MNEDGSKDYFSLFQQFLTSNEVDFTCRSLSPILKITFKMLISILKFAWIQHTFNASTQSAFFLHLMACFTTVGWKYNF